MPTQEFHLNDPRDFEYDDRVIVFDRKEFHARLKKVDLAGNYHRLGLHPVSGTIAFPNFYAESLTELYSMEHKVSGSGTVDYQLSPDNGKNFYYVSSSGTWTLTTSNYSSLNDVDINLSSFPLQFPYQVRLKARLQPTVNRALSPILESVFLNFEYEAGFEEEVERSLKRFMYQRMISNQIYASEVDSGTSVYTINIEDGIKLISIANVYNEDDQTRSNNLLESFTASGTATIQPQQSGTILFNCAVSVPIYLGADPDLHRSQKPSYIIHTLSTIEQKEWKSTDSIYEYSIARLESRKRPHPQFDELDIAIECQHGNPLHAKNMTEAIRRLFKSKSSIPSVLTGQALSIRVVDPGRGSDVDIFSNIVGLKISGFRQLDRGEDYPNPVGSNSLDNYNYAGSGTNQKYETIKLVAPSGVQFKLYSVSGE